MARDVFQMTVTNPDASAKLAALAGVGVTVVARGTNNPVNIYQRPTGATQGPTPESGATGGPNPFTTGASGGIEFWCDGPAELDVKLVDSQGPKRIADRAFGWNALPAAAASIPGSILAADGTLALNALGADIRRQLAQLGQVIEWWRPADSVAIPSGWEICDGRTIAGSAHDFVGTGVTGQPIALPDLRNAFILGAVPATAAEALPGTVYKAKGATAGLDGNGKPTDLVTDAPGIHGAGGSNRHQLLAAESGRPDHTHPASSSDSGHRHNVDNTINYGLPPLFSTAGYQGVGANMIESQTGWANITTTVSGCGNANAAQNHSNTPKWVGLLRLMKVRLS
jgi:hypothetical protein